MCSARPHTPICVAIALGSSNRPIILSSAASGGRGHERAPFANIFRASSRADRAFTIDDLIVDPGADVAGAPDDARPLAFAEFSAATARSVAPLFLGPLLGIAGLLAVDAEPARSSTFLMNGLGRFSTSFMSYWGAGALPSAAAAAKAAFDGATDDDEAEEAVTADVDAARCIFRVVPDDVEADSATVAERIAAEADVARIEGRRSLVGRAAGADAAFVELVLDAVLLAVDWVGVWSPSALS